MQPVLPFEHAVVEAVINLRHERADLRRLVLGQRPPGGVRLQRRRKVRQVLAGDHLTTARDHRIPALGRGTIAKEYARNVFKLAL